jgi:hypothetical protein
MPGYRIVLKPLSDALARENPEWEQDYDPATHAAKRQNRIIEADAIKIIDNGSMLVGIEPHVSSVTRQAIKASRGHAKWLRDRRNNPEFYHIGHTAPGVKPGDPSHTDYIVTRKFRKILSINLDNVISINGKPVMGRLGDLDKGVQHLDIDEGWTIEGISDLLED